MKNYSYISLILVFVLFSYVTNCFAQLSKVINSPALTIGEKKTEDEITHPTSTAEIRGLIKPLREAVLSSNMAAKIAHISVKDGDRFKKGKKLIKFDCNLQNAQLKAAEAETNARKITFKNNQDLSRFNAIGSLELEISKAQFDKAVAEQKSFKVRNQYCVIKAPWNGRVTEIIAREHEATEPGLEIMKILDDDSLEIEMLVPSSWLSWLKPNVNYPMTVDETGRSYKIKIARVGARVDPVSQTVRVFANFDEDAANVLAGMSGTVIFDLPN